MKKYTFNLLVLVILLYLSACNKSQNLDQLSDAEKQLMLVRLEEEMKQAPNTQGSMFRDLKSDTILMLDPEREGTYRGKSMGHTKIGDYHKAFPLLEKSASLDPKESLYYYSWLLLYYYRDYERSLQRLEQYDALTPNEIDYAWGESVLLLKGLAHKQMGNYESAITEFTNSIIAEGKNVDLHAYIYRGISYLRLSRLEEAIKDFDKALSEYDKMPMAHFYKGETLLQQGDQAAAKTAFLNAQKWIQKGYVRTDPYIEFFDTVWEMEVLDKLASIE